jgi:hypothetical protein
LDAKENPVNFQSLSMVKRPVAVYCEGIKGGRSQEPPKPNRKEQFDETIYFNEYLAASLPLSPRYAGAGSQQSELLMPAGTYTYTGSAWQDMSDQPGAATWIRLVSLIGSFTIDGNGDLTGLGQRGRTQQTAEFNRMSRSCRWQRHQPSMRINESRKVYSDRIVHWGYRGGGPH